MGPLAGVRVIEVASIGPGPFAAMMLADMGAEVLRLARPGDEARPSESPANVVNRGRPTLAVDLKDPSDRELVLDLSDRADALIEGFRPGVMERLALGPEALLERNPRLVYGRLTGYGQDGPLASVPGHDINYIAIAGVLGLIARRGERPLFPLNLVGDYGGGGMLLAFGLACALIESRASGKGQVVDAAMVEGSALLATFIHGLAAAGRWDPEPGSNLLDSGAHFYEVYETSDSGHIAVGAIEPKFYANLLRLLGIPRSEAPQWRRERWPELKERFAAVFRSRTRAEWTDLLEREEACATPVLTLDEARAHHHNLARGAFVEAAGVVRPAAAPRLSRTPGGAAEEPDLAQALAGGWGLPSEQIEQLLGSRR